MNFRYHHTRLANPENWSRLGWEAWRHIFWLVSIEQAVTMVWRDGEWVRRD